MDLETVSAVAFMIFALGFFIYVIWHAEVIEERRWNRKMETARTLKHDPKMQKEILKEYRRL